MLKKKTNLFKPLFSLEKKITARAGCKRELAECKGLFG
jgi:hypothetical protein